MGEGQVEATNTARVFVKLTDAIILFNFVMMAFITPLQDAPSCIPANYFPETVITVRDWYSHKIGDYLFIELPHFWVGLVWIEILIHWPMCFISVYAMFKSKPWYNTCCLIYGSSVGTAMTAILWDMRASGKASEHLLNAYYPFMAVAILAILRGLTNYSSTITLSTASSKKKKA